MVWGGSKGRGALLQYEQASEVTALETLRFTLRWLLSGDPLCDAFISQETSRRLALNSLHAEQIR